MELNGRVNITGCKRVAHLRPVEPFSYGVHDKSFPLELKNASTDHWGTEGQLLWGPHIDHCYLFVYWRRIIAYFLVVAFTLRVNDAIRRNARVCVDCTNLNNHSTKHGWKTDRQESRDGRRRLDSLDERSNDDTRMRERSASSRLDYSAVDAKSTHLLRSANSRRDIDRIFETGLQIIERSYVIRRSRYTKDYVRVLRPNTVKNDL